MLYISKAHFQALGATMKKIVTAKNFARWSKMKTSTERHKFYNELLLYNGFPCAQELRDEIDAAFEYEYDIQEYDARFREDTPCLDAPWWHQK